MNYDMLVFPTGNGDSCLKVYVGEEYEISVAFDRGYSGKSASDIRVYQKEDAADVDYSLDVTEKVLGESNIPVIGFGTVIEVIQTIEKLLSQTNRRCYHEEDTQT